MAIYSDGKESMPFVYNDGGRNAAGFKGKAGDCVTRSIAIVSGKDYAEVYKALAHGMGSQRKSKGKTARNGITTKRKWFKEYMRSLGFTWIPTMQIGQGCKVHLLKGELPADKLIAVVSKHYTAVIDGVIHDTFDPTRIMVTHQDNFTRLSHRCVYGYWILTEEQS